MTGRQPEGRPDHEHWEELAVGHALNSLEPADEEAFAAHLPTCQECRRLVADMTDVAADLAYAADSVDPPPGLWQGISAAIASSDRPPLPPGSQASAPGPAGPADQGDPLHVARTGPLHARPADPRRSVEDPKRQPATTPAGIAGPRPAWLRSTALAVAAALIVIAGLGGVVLVGRFLQVRSDKAAAERQLSAVLNCAGRAGCSVVPLNPATGGSASAIALVQPGSVRLVVTNLAPTDRNSTYVLWAGRPDGTVAGVGLFSLDDGGRRLVTADLEATAGDLAGRVLAVSREPGRAIPKAPSTVLLRSAAA